MGQYIIQVMNTQNLKNNKQQTLVTVPKLANPKKAYINQRNCKICNGKVLFWFTYCNFCGVKI